jgi:PAS domain S-box-containing protein
MRDSAQPKPANEEEERDHREEARTLETLLRVAQTVAAELDLERVVQVVTDAATELSEAQFGAFFYNVLDEKGESYTLYTISGVPREKFSQFPMPRNTHVFGPTFAGSGVVRSDDITKDPRYGHNPPYHGMPEGHLPVHSYLAVPVVSRSGEVHGGLFLGHERVGVFGDRAERIVTGIAAQGAIAIDNARLYQRMRETERTYRAIGDSIDYGIWINDALGRNVYCSDSFLKLLGLTQEQCSNDDWSNLLHPDEREKTLADWKECVRTGGVWKREHLYLGKDGEYHPMAARGVPVRNDAGEIVGWAGFNLDIADLKRQQEALRESDRRKDEFLATLAHELRNPLAPLRNGLEILERTGSETPLGTQVRGIMARQLEQMVRLIDDLMDVSRISRGRISVKRERMDLLDAVRTAVDTARPAIDAAEHKLALDLPPGPVVVEGDAVRLAQVFANLLSNAAKYTPRGGDIRLVVKKQGENACVSIKDSGIGISKQMLPRIFDLFVQADRAIERAQGGLGVGLSIAQRITQMHGGNVEAHSEGEGQGTEFVVRLPLARARNDAAKERRERRASPSNHRRILVADDNTDAASTLGAMLELMGHEVMTAADGADAVEKARAFKPEIIFLDVGMPRMNGYDACEAIRKSPGGDRMTIIALTGWGQESHKRRSREAGFDRHFVKPVALDDLQAIFENPPHPAP